METVGQVGKNKLTKPIEFIGLSHRGEGTGGMMADYVSIGAELLEPDEASDPFEFVGQGGTLLAVVPVPGTDTSLAIVGYPIAVDGSPALAAPGAAGRPKSRATSASGASLVPRATQAMAAPADAQVADARVADRQVAGTPVADARVMDRQVAGTRVADAQVADTRVTDATALPTRAVQRQAARYGPAPGELVEGGAGFALDHARRRVWIGRREIELTFQEFELLAFLTSHPATVFTRAELVARVWQRECGEDSRTVDVHVSRLRQKLGPRYARCLITEYRVGYQFRPTGPRRSIG